MDRALQELLDKTAIHEVLVRYCRGIDRCDMDTLRSAYWEDGTDDHGTFNGNAMDFCDYIIPSLKHLDRTMHLISNVHIELNGEWAKVETYCVAHHLGGDNEFIVGGRYLDRMEKREDEWRIKTRVYVMDWNQNNPATAEWSGRMYGALATRGARYPDDPWYDFG